MVFKFYAQIFQQKNLIFSLICVIHVRRKTETTHAIPSETSNYKSFTPILRTKIIHS